MIETRNLAPEVYYKRSRDFQALGRVYDIIFNYLKTNINVINNLPYSENIDDKLISLVATTLGFKEIHEYNIKELKALCSVFVNLLRNKGNKKSITDLLNLILNVENLSRTKSDNVIVEELQNLLIIYVPSNIKDLSLLEDVLTYILPAGGSYRIIKELIVSSEASTPLVVGKNLTNIQVKSSDILDVSQIIKLDNSEDTYIEKSAEPGIGRIEDIGIIKTEEYTGKTDDQHFDPVKLYPKE